MKQLLVILLMSLCMCFSKDKVQSASNVDSHIDVYLIDEKGENIFAPEYKGKRNFEVLIPKRWRFVKFYDPLSYAPNGYVINSDYSIRIFLNLPFIGDSHSFTYVRFNEGKIIKIKTDFYISIPDSTNQTFGGGTIAKEKICFNDTQIWKSTNNTTVIPRIQIFDL